jgi:hypothetical protein
MRGQWREKARAEIRSTGYVAHSLEAALGCVDRTTDYRDAVLMAANLGEDADTTAAITGQLAGALYGLSGISGNWAGRVAWGERIKATASGWLGRQYRTSARRILRRSRGSGRAGFVQTCPHVPGDDVTGDRLHTQCLYYHRKLLPLIVALQ